MGQPMEDVTAHLLKAKASNCKNMLRSLITSKTNMGRK